MKVAEKIEQQIQKMPAGTTFKYQQLNIAKSEYSAAAKAIERLITKERIKRISTGVFYKPRQTRFGTLRPREQELIRPYLFTGNKRIAYITGTALYNRLGLTSQVPKTIKIASKTKRIWVKIGNIQAKPVKSYVEVTNNNYYLLELLDVLKDFTKIPDLDKQMTITFLLKKLGTLEDKERTKIIKYALQYPPRTRALLGALISKLNKKEEVKVLKKSLNPFTHYKLGVNNNLLPTAPNWNIQ